MAKITCQKCGRTMQEVKFFSYRTGEKFQICKECITLHVDNFDEDTYLWIIKKADAPWVPLQWNKIRDREYAKHGGKLKGTSVIGKYLSWTKLKQNKEYTWDTSQELCKKVSQKENVDKEAQEVRQEQLKNQLENGEISQAQYRTLVSSEFQKQNEYIMVPKVPQQDAIGKDNAFNEKDFFPEEELPDLAADLTLEDKKYLVMKWGRTYKMNQLIELEKKYTQMTNSFDIQDADSKNSLILICKTYLKMNQSLDCGDVEGYGKYSRAYDMLRKSAKFTAAQNKEEKGNVVDSVGELVAFCQKNGGRIPRFQIKQPDAIDKIIDDLKAYNRSLIYEDAALARQVQDYLKQARAQQMKKEDVKMAKEQGFDVPQLTEEDTLAYKEFLRQQASETDKITRGQRNLSNPIDDMLFDDTGGHEE